MNYIEKVVIGIMNCFVWCIPLSIFTKIFYNSFTIGYLMGMICYMVVAPRFNIVNDLFEKKL